MSERDDEALSAAVLNVETVPVPEHPVPDFRASADGSTAPDQATPPRSRRRLIGSTKPAAEPGSRDSMPRSQRAIKAPKPEKTNPPIPNGGFAPAVTKMYGTIALAVMPLDMELASAILEVAEPAAAAWDELARRNMAVRRVLVAMMQTTAAGALFAAHMPIILLFVQRAMGDNPRVSMIGDLLASQSANLSDEADAA